MSMMLIPGGIIIPVHAAPGDQLLTINNPTPKSSDYFGRSVASTTNGNILIGASSDDTGATNAGSAYLFDGDTGSLLLTIDNPTPDTSENFGFSVAGTVNGNILVGAYSDHTGATNTGSAYLFDGTDGSLLLTINNPTPGVGDNFGFSIAGTVNGNIIVGASSDDTSDVNVGSAYLFDGTLRGTTSTPLLTINNPTPERIDYFGASVAGTTNGNIIVGAHGDNTGALDTGSAYLFDGTDGSLLLTINNPTPEVNDRFATSVASTTDGNIIVGAHYDDTGVYNAGSAYLFDGTDGSLLLTINNPTPGVGDYFGKSVASTTDDNILVGAEYSGSAYLFDGTDGSLLLTINNPAPETGDYFGIPVAGTVNGSIIVGAWHNGDGSSAGSAYLFEGIATDTSTPPTITSIVADDPDDLDNVYSADDTITITFDSDTNTPGGTGIIQNKTAIDDLYTFTESLGETYTGQWITADTFVITISNTTGATPPIINNTTVTPAGITPILSSVTSAGITPILSSDEISAPSTDTSPVLSGDFGLYAPSTNWNSNGFIPKSGVTIANYTKADIDSMEIFIGGSRINYGTSISTNQVNIGDDVYYAYANDDVYTKSVIFVMLDTADGIFIKPLAATYQNGFDLDPTQNKEGAWIAEASNQRGYGLASVVINFKD